MPEKIRWFPSLVHWVGFQGATLSVEHANRKEGKSSYTLRKLINLSIDVFLLNSEMPIRMIAKFGFLVSLLSVIYSIVTVVRYYLGNITVGGYTSLIVSVLFFSGIIIFFLGVIGLYIAKIFQQVKDRPIFIIKERTN